MLLLTLGEISGQQWTSTMMTRTSQAIANGVQLTTVGKEFMHNKVVKVEVFVRQKCATLDRDLLFSNNPNSICQYMANRLKVQEAEVETWWETQRQSEHAQLKKVRNNALKILKDFSQVRRC
jgi:formaldehyde-activating enzyme involved in methanogenesis